MVGDFSEYPFDEKGCTLTFDPSFPDWLRLDSNSVGENPSFLTDFHDLGGMVQPHCETRVARWHHNWYANCAELNRFALIPYPALLCVGEKWMVTCPFGWTRRYETLLEDVWSRPCAEQPLNLRPPFWIRVFKRQIR